MKAPRLSGLKIAPFWNGKSQTLDRLGSLKHYLSRERFELQWKPEQPKAAAHVIFLLDTSGSMALNKQMAQVKGLIEQTIQQQRFKKLQYALILLENNTASIAQAFTHDWEKITELNYGLRSRGKTNLGDAFRKVHELSRKIDKQSIQLFTFTDGKVNVGDGGQEAFAYALASYKKWVGRAIHSTLIDTEQGFVKLGKAKELAEKLKLHYVKMEE